MASKDPIEMWNTLCDLAGVEHGYENPDRMTEALWMRGHSEWKNHHVRDALADYLKAKSR